jgi:hypothetical protein
MRVPASLVDSIFDASGTPGISSEALAQYCSQRMAKGSGRRQSAQMQDVLGELASRVEEPAKGRRDPATELAESFRKASKALESAARDVVALRKRGTKTPR